MDDNTYEGWKGFGDIDSAWATWNAALWVDNDYETYKGRTAFASAGEWTATKARQFYMRAFPLGTPDMKRRKGHINFVELADHWNAE